MTEQDIGSGLAGEPGVAYDEEKLGEPGQPGVPAGDQHPTTNAMTISAKVGEARISESLRKRKHLCGIRVAAVTSRRA
jgi:hypothetical protein